MLLILVLIFVQLHCCGIHNASDWMTSPAWKTNHTNSVPESCCINQSNVSACNTRINSTDIYKEVDALLKSLAFFPFFLALRVTFDLHEKYNLCNEKCLFVKVASFWGWGVVWGGVG